MDLVWHGKKVGKTITQRFLIYSVLVAVVHIDALFAKSILKAFFCLHREKIQFIRTEGTPGLVRLSSDADLVMLLR